MQDAKPIGGTQGKKPNILKTPAHEYEKYLNGPSIAILGLCGQNSEDSALQAVSVEEVYNYRRYTTNNSSLAICVDSGVSEHYFDDTPGLRGRLSDYEVREEPRKKSLLQVNSWKEMLRGSSPMLS